jgi:serine/threonine protein kinase
MSLYIAPWHGNASLAKIVAIDCLTSRSVQSRPQIIMTSEASAYAIHFNEGPGYLFVVHLGRGLSGKAMLVRSCAHPHKLYVRKRVLNRPRQSESEIAYDEIFRYPPFKFVPELIDWTEYGSETYSMTMQFCNGGSLLDLISHKFFKHGRPIAEICMWRIFTELLQTLEFIHHERSVAHLDVLPQNVFLHWSDEEGSKDQDENSDHLPEVYLGDFGLADSIRLGHMQHDLRMLHTTLIIVGLGMSGVGFGTEDWMDRFPRTYSSELRTCLAMLPEPWGLSEQNNNNYIDECAPSTKVLRSRIMPIALKKMAQLERKRQMVDYRFTKPKTETEVKLHEAKSDFDVQDVDEPFSYARVNRETLAVIEIETKPDAITPRGAGKGYIWN